MKKRAPLPSPLLSQPLRLTVAVAEAEGPPPDPALASYCGDATGLDRSGTPVTLP